jgi:spore coat polysaccharide biosynthesis protein SpsF
MPELIDQMVAKFYEANVDYLSNTLEPTYPDGLDVEIVRPSVFAKLASLDLSGAEREHVTLGIYSRPSIFKLEKFLGDVDLSQRRWTVDYLEDLVFVRRIFNEFKGGESTFDFEDTMLFLANEPDLKSAISADRRNEKLGGKNIGE